MVVENNVLEKCRDAYELLGLAAFEAKAPRKGLDLCTRTLVLDLLAFRIAQQKKLLGSPLSGLADDIFGQSLVKWSVLAEAFSLFAGRKCGADLEKQTGFEGLWPLNEFVSENALSQALILIANIDENVPVRVLGDVYQMLLELPVSGIKAEREKRNMKIFRRRKGIYFTPQHIIDRIIKLAIPSPVKGKNAPFVCDPAMGTAHFLISVAWYLSGGDIRSARHIAATRLYGVDSNPEIVRLARISLWLEFSSPLVPFEVPEHFCCGDSLVGTAWEDSEKEHAVRKRCELEYMDWNKTFPEIEKQGGFDVIVGNPPYDVLTGFRNNPDVKLYVEYLRKSGLYTFSTSGQLNLYRLFVERSLNLLKNGGGLSFIIPSSFLTDKIAANLRKEMLNHHRLDKVEHYSESEKSFEDVGQSVIIFHASKNKGSAVKIDLQAMQEDGGIIERRQNRINLNVIKSLDPELEPIPVAGREDWEIIKWITENCSRNFSDLAEGYVGEVDQTVFSDCMQDKKGALLVRGCHVSAFNVDLSDTESKDRFIDEKKFLNKKGDSFKEKEPSLKNGRIAQLGIRNMECIPRLVAARVPEGVYLGNSVNYWLPKEGVPSSLILALLNSSFYDWRFRLTSSNNNINVYEILSLPVAVELVDYFTVHKREKMRSKSKVFMVLNEIENKVKAVEKASSIGGDISKYRTVIDEVVFHMFSLPAKMRSYIMSKSIKGKIK